MRIKPGQIWERTYKSGNREICLVLHAKAHEGLKAAPGWLTLQLTADKYSGTTWWSDSMANDAIKQGMMVQLA